jgi:hypothetical protein
MITDANDFVRDPRSSSGPRTEEGLESPSGARAKARSSRNSLKFGLFTAHDFIRDGEEDAYADTFTSLMSELAPDNTAEETFVLEAIGATWRLRRCRLVEEGFSYIENLDSDPLIDERTEKQQKSVDRARAQSHLILRRSLAELRTLQKIRKDANPEPKKQWALSWCPAKGAPPTDTFYPDGTHVDHTAPPPETTSPAASSFCNPVGKVSDLPSTEPAAPKQTPRNAPCPCGSGAKYKRCCGKDAPPVLNRAA